MQVIFGIMALAALSEALISRSQSCCFQLTANGGPGGEVSQLSDGQNRIGQSGLTDGTYCIDSNGGLTDSSGRGCILTPPTTQWQCDSGATPTPGFSVGCEGTLTYENGTTFWACPTGDDGGYNIYSQQLTGEPACVRITLTADSCASECSSPACPATLPATFEYPHLIIPIDSTSPDKAYTNSYNGTASGSISTIFDFDIPSSTSGQTCTLEFLFPELSQLETSSYSFSGTGGVDFSLLAAPAVQGTTYASMPKVADNYGTTTLVPGHAYTIATMACPAGEKIGIWMEAEGSTCLNYFQDYNPCPIGLYITYA